MLLAQHNRLRRRRAVSPLAPPGTGLPRGRRDRATAAWRNGRSRTIVTCGARRPSCGAAVGRRAGGRGWRRSIAGAPRRFRSSRANVAGRGRAELGAARQVGARGVEAVVQGLGLALRADAADELRGAHREAPGQGGPDPGRAAADEQLDLRPGQAVQGVPDGQGEEARPLLGASAARARRSHTYNPDLDRGRGGGVLRGGCRAVR